MNKWKILGIEPTTDKKTIKQAYREKLKKVNPETRPEEFMELREAYERALAAQKMEMETQEVEAEADEDEEELDLVEDWQEKLNALYGDNERRFRIECWEELLEEEVCHSLETRAQVANIFLNAIDDGDDYTHVSLEVLQLADRVFHFAEREDELVEEFGMDYLDYFLNYRLKKKEYPPYEYFGMHPVKDADYDEYIELAREFIGFCESAERENAIEILGTLDETGIKHPYVEIRRVKLFEKDEQIALEKLTDIEKIWGESEETVFAKGEYFLKCKKYNEAEKCFRRTMELEPAHEKALYFLIISLCEQNEYKEARKILVKINDPNVRIKFTSILAEIEDQLVFQLEESVSAKQISEEDRYLLSVIFYSKGKIEESEQILDSLKNRKEWEIKCLRIRALIAEARNDWDDAIWISDKFLAKMEKEEATEENKALIAEINMMCGRVFLHLRQKEKAIEYMDAAIALESSNEEYCFHKASVLMAFHLYELAAEELSILLKKNSRSAMYRFGRGKCYYELDLMKEAHEDFEYISVWEKDAYSAFVYRLRIYLKLEQWEDAKAMFQFFEKQGWDTDTVRMLKAVYHEYLGNLRTAEKMLNDILDDYNPEESDLEHVGEVYYHLAQIDIEYEKKIFQVLRRLKKGIEADPDYIPLYEECWELNEQAGDIDDVKMYLYEILRLSPYHQAARDRLSEIQATNNKLSETRAGNGNDESELEAMIYSYCHLGQYENAREWVVKLKEEGNEVRADELLYEIELECGNFEEASEYMKKWNKARGKTVLNYEYHVKCARIRLAKLEYKMAKFFLDETDVATPEGNVLLGAYFIYQAKGKKALKVLEYGMDLWPKETRLYYYAALASLLLENKANAEEYAQKGISMLKEDKWSEMQTRKYYRQMGAFLAITGKYERAKEYLEKALCKELCYGCVKCQCPKVDLDLALMYHLMGDDKACAQTLERAEQIKSNDFQYCVLKKLIETKKI